MNTVPAQSLSAVSPADRQIIRMWLHGKQPNTAAAYQADLARFLAHAGKPIADIELADLQAYAQSMSDASAATRARRLSAVKSLLAFAVKGEFITSNPGAALQVAKVQVTSGDHLLSEVDVRRMIGGEPDARRRAVLRLLYVCGLRASEACGLRWRDMTGTDRKGGEAKILGKGGKLRTVVVPADLWRELAALTPALNQDSPVLPGARGALLRREAIHRIVKRAAKRAGVTESASAHWLRHSHASHALDNGCKVHVLAESLGHASLATTSRYAHARAGERSASFIKG
jgi:integrase/recombinase XerD